MTRRFGLMILLGCAVLAAASGLRKLRLDTDVLGMLPRDMPEVRGLSVFHNDYARQDELVLLIEGGEDEEGLLAEYAESLANELNQASVARRVRWNPQWTEQGEGLAELLAYFWLNGETDEVLRLTEKFALEHSPQSFANSLAAVATAMEGEDMMMRANDPLGLLRHPSANLLINAAGQGGMGFESADGRGHLLLLDSPGPVASYREAGEWIEKVRAVVEKWRKTEGDGLTVRITGEPAFSSEIGGAMERDMRGTVGITMGLISLLFWWMQRRLRLLAGLMVTLGLVFLTALGLAGWIYGELSIMAAGFAAVLIGLAVDYGVLICQEAKMVGHDPSALRSATAKSILWAAATTAVVFFALNFSGLPGIAQLGTMVACGILAGAVLMLGLYLPFVTKAGAGRVQSNQGNFSPLKLRGPGWISAVLLLAAVLSLLLHGLPAIGFDAKMMRPRNSQAMLGFERVQALFPQWNADDLRLVVEADDAASMRQRLLKAQRRVEAQPLIDSAALPVHWWPDEQRQATNNKLLTDFLEADEFLMKSASDAGFSDDGLALSKAVFSALKTMSSENGIMFPKSEVAREMMRMFVNYQEDGSGSVAGVINLTDGIQPADKDYESLRNLSGEGIWLTGWTLLRPAVAPLVTRDLTHVFLPMVALMVVMLGFMFRSLRECSLIIAALALSGALLLAIMSWTGMRWNFLNIAATPLLLGTGIDYGIHVMMTLRRNGGDVVAMWHGTGKAVVFCGCSTAIGFGSLCFASNDALASLGTVAVTGILISMLVSVFLLPAWAVKTKIVRPSPHRGHH